MTTTRSTIRKRLNRAMRELEEVEREVVVFMDGASPDLVGTTEAAEILGVKPTTISANLRRGRFPEPIVRLACGPIWLRETIEHRRDYT
jgi:DNA-directed RNA polymerase specialized sigma24 family protein